MEVGLSIFFVCVCEAGELYRKKNLLVPRRAKAVLKECAKCAGTFKIITAFDL